MGFTAATSEPRLNPSTESADPTGLIDLVMRASTEDQCAWEEIVDRFLPLVQSIVRSHRLSTHDAEDVHQMVWLKLFERLPTIAAPAALPRWIATVTRNECINVIRGLARCAPGSDEAVVFHLPAVHAADEHVLRAEDFQAVLEGYAMLPAQDRALLALLLAEPPASYKEISGRLGLPIGSIGPTRARTLRRLRGTPSVRRLLVAQPTG